MSSVQVILLAAVGGVMRKLIAFKARLGNDAHNTQLSKFNLCKKEPGMKDIYTLIRQKEADLERIQHELEALRLSARLLEEDIRPAVAATTSSSAASAVFSAPSVKPQTGAQPGATPAAWASAKQFP
jgi:hypothetical protein